MSIAIRTISSVFSGADPGTGREGRSRDRVIHAGISPGILGLTSLTSEVGWGRGVCGAFENGFSEQGIDAGVKRNWSKLSPLQIDQIWPNAIMQAAFAALCEYHENKLGSWPNPVEGYDREGRALQACFGVPIGVRVMIGSLSGINYYNCPASTVRRFQSCVTAAGKQNKIDPRVQDLSTIARPRANGDSGFRQFAAFGDGACL